MKSDFNNEINSNSETKFEHNTMTISDRTGINASDIFKWVSKESEAQNSNAKGGITITKEERSQRSTRSRSGSRSLPQISSSSHYLQKQQQQQEQNLMIYWKNLLLLLEIIITLPPKEIIMIEQIIIQDVFILHEDHQPS